MKVDGNPKVQQAPSPKPPVPSAPAKDKTEEAKESDEQKVKEAALADQGLGQKVNAEA